MKIKVVLATAILSIGIMTPTIAQQAAITWNALPPAEYCFQYIPNSNCDPQGYSRFYTGVGVTGAMAQVPGSSSQRGNSQARAIRAVDASGR
jgi:hypothetical protein